MCTKYIQTNDVVWNKPFRLKVAELCDEWLANGFHKFMKFDDNGNENEEISCFKLVKPCPGRYRVLKEQIRNSKSPFETGF